MADEAPAKAATESTATAAAPAAETTTSQPDVNNLSLSQIDTLMETGKVEIPAASEDGGKAAEDAAAPAATPETPAGDTPPEKKEEPAGTETPAAAAVTPETPAGETPAAAPAPAAAAAEPEPDDKAKRFRVKDPLAKAALELYKAFEDSETPISLAEAERRVRGEATPAAAPTETTAATDTPETVTVEALEGTVTTLTDEIKAIETKLEEAGAGEGLYNTEIAKLTVELTNKRVELSDTKRDLKETKSRTEAEAAEIRKQSDAARAKAHENAIALFPDAADKNTPLGKAVSEQIRQMKDPKHPDHAILYADSAPLTIVRDVAARLKIAPKEAPTAVVPPPVTPAATPPVRTPVVSPTPGNKTAVTPVKPAEDLKQQVDHLLSDKATLQELDEFCGAGDEAAMLAGAARR